MSMSDEELEKLSLVNLNGGAAVEMFDNALQKVLENIQDINTGEGFREINLKVKMKPMSDEDRKLIGYSIECTPKLVGQPAVTGLADMKIEGGRLVAVDRKQKQRELSFDVVTPIRKGE